MKYPKNASFFTYPDVMVVAGEREYFNNRSDTIVNPLAIVEVLSKSTQNYDREQKFEAYRSISTLQEYILIDQTRIYLEQFSRTGKKQWSFREYDREDKAIALISLDCEILLSDVYHKVRFEATPELDKL